MKIVFVKETLHSNKKNTDYYCVRYALLDANKNIVAKSSPLIWLTKEQYDSLNI